jgi:ABC-type lipoprotein export system ATPase subunit
MITIRHLTKKYNNAPILKDINHTIKSGDKVLITGASWCGKTTLLNIIAGIDQDYSWDISILKTQISQLNSHDSATFRRENIGYVFQFFNLHEHYNVEENITLISQLYATQSNPKKRARSLMKKLSIDHLKNTPIKQLSWWELQRVAIARALFCKPKILLLDEATAHLDKKNMKQFYKLLEKIHTEENLTIISVKHNENHADFYNSFINLSYV